MSALPAITFVTDDEFDRLVVLGDPRVRGRVELREGALKRMNAEYTPHARLATRIARALEDAMTAARLPLEVVQGGTVRFGGGFSPMPDVLVWTPTAYSIEGPFPGSALELAVEVADKTRADDLGDKRRDYAKAGLPEYWVADIQKRQFRRFSAPADGDYAADDVFLEGEAVQSATLPGVVVTVQFP
jgi:Uma2 family endonuclease